VSSSLGSSSPRRPWKWKNHGPSKRQELLTEGYSFTSEE